jgi:U6 snRNA-associated Sm-like protein LSm2
MFYAILKSICQNNSKVTVELKNDMEIKGNLVSVDTNLNLVISKPNFDEAENIHQLKNTYNIFIRGNVIRYIHFDKKEMNTELIEEACKKLNNEENE